MCACRVLQLYRTSGCAILSIGHPFYTSFSPFLAKHYDLKVPPYLGVIALKTPRYCGKLSFVTARDGVVTHESMSEKQPGR